MKYLFVFSFCSAALMWAAPVQAAVSGVSAVAAAGDLVRRLLPPEAASHFVLTEIPPAGSNDVYEIESHGGKIDLRGNNGAAMASALNAYLREYCKCDISWGCGNQLALPATLPVVPQKVRVVSPYRYRYVYNFCTHGYTMAWWDWPQWEKELDYLALNGINLALVIEGQESVWQATLEQLGYTDAEIRQWLVMPSHQPWMDMSNIEGYGGPVPQGIIDRRGILGRKIIERMNELGINPVLQGYYGIVPEDFSRRFPDAKCHVQGKWGDLKRPDMLEPGTPGFTRVAALFYEQQARLFGQARFFAADPFHEGGNTDSIDLPACGRAIFNAMGNATWVIQSWQQNPRLEMIDGLDKSRLLILDLQCEAQENWRARNNFDGTPWLWCMIENFGGNVGLGGRLEWAGAGPARARQDPVRGNMSGVGALMEGSRNNPAIWEMFFENTWRGTEPDVHVWLHDYVRRRYGADSESAREAWEILAVTVYGNPPSKVEYPINSVICGRPSLKLDSRARGMVSTEAGYKTSELAGAWRLLLAAAPETAQSDGYRYDLVDVGREVLARIASDYQRHMLEAYAAKDGTSLERYGDKMLGLIQDMDRLVGTRPEFLLGNWLADARAWGGNSAESDLCERNARELLTVWTSTYNISDYANRQWNGLLTDYYRQRWAMWIGALQESLRQGKSLDEAATRDKIHAWEIEWTCRTNHFPAAPTGDSVAVSAELFEKYSGDSLQTAAETSSVAPRIPKETPAPQSE